MRRVNDLAIEIGQAVHRPDEGLLDRAGGLVGARVQVGTAILRGSGAALDELACGFRDFKLVLKPAKRLRKRLVGRGAGLDRGLRRPFLLLRHLTSPSSLRANGDPVRYRPEEYPTLARFMLHRNINCALHKIVIATRNSLSGRQLMATTQRGRWPRRFRHASRHLSRGGPTRGQEMVQWATPIRAKAEKR